MYLHAGVAIVMFAVIIICSYQAVMLKFERKLYLKAYTETQETIYQTKDMHQQARVHLDAVAAMHLAEGKRLASYGAGKE